MNGIINGKSEQQKDPLLLSLTIPVITPFMEQALEILLAKILLFLFMDHHEALQLFLSTFVTKH
jgi:hypothetical protein